MTELNNDWQTICHEDDLITHSGVCALLTNDEQIAIFKVNDTEVYSIGNWDPAGKANVLYRGIIGDHNNDIFVASPLYKQRFSLNGRSCNLWPAIARRFILSLNSLNRSTLV